MDNIYDRIDILIHDQELTARPIEFEMDKDENPIRATKYETTCPNCSNYIQFDIPPLQNPDGSIVKESGQPPPRIVSCPNCSSKPVHIEKSSLVIKKQGQMIEQAPQVEVKKDRGCPFLDPIELGAFDPVALYDKLVTG